MKFEWNALDFGGKTICASAGVATLSMLMDWVNVGFASANGFSQGTFLLLAAWAYPLSSILNARILNRGYGYIGAAIACISTFAYMQSKTIDLFGKSVNVSAGGAVLFLMATVALAVGISKYSTVPNVPDDLGSKSE
jgi:hypothetical protein